jgi:hypothetical protein
MSTEGSPTSWGCIFGWEDREDAKWILSLNMHFFAIVFFNAFTSLFPKPEVPRLEMHYEMHCSVRDTQVDFKA